MAQGQRALKREGPDQAALRWERVRRIQEIYGEQVAEDGTVLQTAEEGALNLLHRYMGLLGFSVTPIHEDIYLTMLAFPSHLREGDTARAMTIMAQRSQSKSTLLACAAVYMLIHNPHYRVGVCMPTEKLAKALIRLITQTFELLPELAETFLPDPRAGDRANTEEWDIHHSLKGVDKSPSVGAVSMMGSLQGRRMDFACCDDLEQDKLARTAEMREILLSKSNDLNAICLGRIVYLGTPQTEESIYFTLADRGTSTYVWPGRYPTRAEVPYYRGTLAPYIVKHMEADPSLQTGGGPDGSRGQVTCPEYLTEKVHRDMELAGGPAWYELQYMLNITKSASSAKALKSRDVVVVEHGSTFPVRVDKGMGPSFIHKHMSGGKLHELSLPSSFSDERKAPVIRAYVDPAAGGSVSGDRTAFAVCGLVAGNVVLLSYGSFPGGYDKQGLYKLAEALCPHKPVSITIEKNMGYGAFKEVFQPIMLEVAQKHGFQPGVDEELVKGQKELRIIETLAPVMARGSLWVTARAISEEDQYLEGIPAGKGASYSLWHQLNNITRAKGCLAHDDSVESLASCVNLFREELALDADKVAKSIQKNAHKQMTKEMLDFLSGKTR